MGERSERWFKQWQIGRLRLSWKIYRHRYAVGPDRWVIQPTIVYDRKGLSF
jgi:hypothetical protein